MKFCPKHFGQDMTDQRNLDYCRSIQTFERCSKCDFYELEKSNKNHTPADKNKISPDRDQGKLF